ncbi:lecithin retinol acyltransferase family protein [Treponema primitia]|uniref:lecithin retinol acyltransferase family protein n=1 Tax=Treponema primitia TaxID=88058 RepID=UPI00397FDE1A
MGLFDIIDDIQDSLNSKLDDIFDPLLGVSSEEEEEVSEKSHRLKKGDVIYTDRGVYQHYGVYIGRKKVIHYASETGDFGDDICVHETSLDNFLKGGECYKIEFSEDYDWGKYRKNTKVPVLLKTMGPIISVGDNGVIGLINKIKKSSEYHLYSGEETVERARSRIGENEYNLALNNCEHFAVWCKTGLSESKQVEAVLGGFPIIPILVH